MSENKPSVFSLQIDTFGNLLRFLRKRAQLTQRELAIAVGYSEAHISRLEGEERLLGLLSEVENVSPVHSALLLYRARAQRALGLTSAARARPARCAWTMPARPY